MNRRLHVPAKLARLGGWTAAAVAIVMGAPGLLAAQPAGSTAAVLTASAAPVLDVVPKPVSVTAGTGHFSLDGASRILAAPGSATVTAAELAVAGDLAAYLRPARSEERRGG